MNLESLINQTFQEKEFYELLLFDIEENYKQYSSKFIHFYFERTNDQKIKITDIVYFADINEIDIVSRMLIEKKEWFEIDQNVNHYNLLLIRFDRTGFLSSIWKDSTHTQEWKHGWADEGPDLGPMTPEEIRQGFLELMGVIQDEQELQKLKPKKAV